MPPVSIKQGVPNYDYVAYKSDPYFRTKAVPDVERGYELLKYLFGKEGTYAEAYAEAYGEEGVEYKIEGGKFTWLDEAAHVRSNPARVVSSYLKLPLLDPIPLISDSMERCERRQ
jgi:hypothetical protein